MEKNTQNLPEGRALAQTRGDSHVHFRDSEGGIWEVHEVLVAPGSPWARGERCLLFRSPGSIRRVWSYPPDWKELAQEELERLSWRT